MKSWSAAILVVALLSARSRADDRDVAFGDVVNRIGVYAQLGDGWESRYDGGTSASQSISGGVGADLVAGNDNFGLALGAGLLYDRGSAPPNMVDDALWMAELSVGFEAAPYAPIRRKHFELRLHLGGRAGMLLRTSCNTGRCSAETEPDLGFALVLTTGVIAWWGEHRSHGLGLDAVFMRGGLGDITPHATDPVTTAEFTPPAFMLRLTYMLFRGKQLVPKATSFTPTPMTEPTDPMAPRVPTR
ncbi:MAG: hypothetical protein ABI867_17470 [Kofleriaceae bacterium]